MYPRQPKHMYIVAAGIELKLRVEKPAADTRHKKREGREKKK